MVLNLKIILMALIVVAIAVFVLFYVCDGIVKVMNQCEKDKSINVCKTGTLPIIILMMLLIVGGLIVIVNITAYIMISGAESNL